ncbi:putative protein MSS51 homolog, mitochondrial [Nilaparvata lugens]|uniref:putative protein MSS51 homolog, mitochondrial n=1 Tax=Nilaparvata lugens TaxID=108931 RepID=UPI00193E8896|nr:putative protein MSS51 homolog, mitochondrial [Nilaparvata lugens]XP_039277635.1 putative protein MSS51 homolog, mitochondrial [Nilaparvata lugens]XP_039277636.1 putative protein MSS51 homolog, mitochondrial [Nilaparvata lugens]
MGKKHKNQSCRKDTSRKNTAARAGIGDQCKYENPSEENGEAVAELRNIDGAMIEEINLNTIQSKSVNGLLDSLKLGKKSNNCILQKQLKFPNYYLHYVCQVCKSIIGTADRCSKCQMIAYCSKEHRRQHWSVHADLCEAIQDARNSQNVNAKHILDGVIDKDYDFFKSFCYSLMAECEYRMQRKLENWEKELFLYPNVCETCFQCDSELLTSCEKCHHRSYCRPEHQNADHSVYCEHLQIYYEMRNQKFLHGDVEVTLPKDLHEQPIGSTDNMDLYLNSTKESLNKLHYLQLCDIATGPLTALYAYNHFTRSDRNNRSNSSVVIHVVGAEKFFEVNTLQKWEIFFLHYLPDLKNLKVIFIGPELDMSEEEIISANTCQLCDKCVHLKRTLKFSFISNTLYHDFAAGKSFQMPSLVCAFNAGMYRTTGYNEQDTWRNTIIKLFSWKHLPVLITEYTSEEAEKDMQRISAIQKVKTLIPPSQNPFSGRCPNLNFVSYHKVPVIFKNYYMLLLQRG